MLPVTTLFFDPDQPDIRASPYAMYQRLQKDAPVSYNPKGFWFVARYDDVASALRDPRFSNRPAPFALLHARHRTRSIAADVAAHLVAFQDAPAHMDIRRPLALALGQRLRNVEADMALIATRVATGLPAGDFDAVSDWAAPTALRTTAHLIGLPTDDLPRIAAWTSDFFHLFHAIPDKETLARLNGSVADFRDYALRLLATPDRVGLIADLAASDSGANPVALADNLMLLIADGVENVRAGLAVVADILLQHPALHDQWLSAPQTLDRAIDEALRLESPGQYQGRITLEPVEIGGRHIRARSIVLLGYGAANRDPATFTNPDLFDPHRAGPRNMTFGMGPHACLGLAMVRVQMRAGIAALLARGVAHSDVGAARDWVPRAGHRWLARLPLRCTA